jgi:hypothetical protein
MTTNTREYGRAWYARKRSDPTFMASRSEIRKRRVQKLLTWVSQYKAARGCKYCPESESVCLDFHHRDPKKKEINIATAVQYGWSKQRLMKEITKCDVVCSNCHRKLENGISVRERSP